MFNINFCTSVFCIIISLEQYLALMSDLEYDIKLNIRIDHSLDDSNTPSFTRRGDLYSKSIYSDAVTFKQNQLTKENIIALKELAKKNVNYRMRAVIKKSDGKENAFYTFVKACSLVESHLHDVLFINLDPMGNVMAITSASPAICTGADVEDKYLVNFNTSVYIRHMELGPLPDTASYVQKLEKEREAKERGEGKDNRSFLSKYWMYIIPLVILFLIPSTTNNESGGNNQR